MNIDDMDYGDYIRHVQAMAVIKAHTDASEWVFENARHLKKVIGSSFAFAELFTCECLLDLKEDPGRLDYFVIEPHSKCVLSFAWATRGEAIANARDVIEDAGFDAVADYIERCKRANGFYSKPKLVSVKPRKIGRRMKAIFEESNGQCHYCQAALTLDGKWHIEHKMPRALGGGNEPTNLVAACIPCSTAKRDRTDVEFIALRAAQASA